MKKYVQQGAIQALSDVTRMFNMSFEEQKNFLDSFLNDSGYEYEEVEYRTINAYPGRVYVVKCGIDGETTLGIGIPFAEEGEVFWKYLHIYPDSTPYHVQKLYQIADSEVIDVVAELFGNVGQMRGNSPSELLTDSEKEWIANNFRVQGV